MAAKKKQQTTGKPAPTMQEKPSEKVTVETTATVTADSFLEKLGKKSVWVALGLLMVVAAIVYRKYLSGEFVFFFKDIGSDTYNYSFPYTYSVAEYIQKYGMPSWSFNRSMGQSLYPFCLRDPFDLFMYMSGPENLIHATIYKEYAKVVLGGLFFFYYLRTVGLTAFTSIAGSLFFAFSGFMVIGGSWALFSFEAMNLALLLLAFEQLLLKKNLLLFPIPIFLFGVSQPFNLWVYGIFLIAYAILRMYQTGLYDVKKGAVLFLQMAGLSVIGLTLSGFMVLENIVQLLESPRGSGNTSYAHILSSTPMFKAVDQFQLGTAVTRFFCSDLMGAGSNFKGWQNTLEAPLFYCGIPSLVLLPQVFPALSKKLKIAFLAFLLLWLLPLFFPWFRYAFWLFTGDYYRAYSMVVACVLLFYAALGLDTIVRTRRVNLPILGITIAVLFMLLNYPYFPDGSYIDSAVFTFVSFMVLVYGVVLFLMGRKGSPAYMGYILLAAIALEVSYFAGMSVNDREPISTAELTEKKGYNDYTMDALAAIRKTDNSFFRVDKAYASSPAIHYSLNDALTQNYHGTSGYNSFNQLYYIRFLQLLGISDRNNEQESRWARGLIGRPLLESANRVKYMMDKGFTMPIWRVVGDSIGTYGDVRVFRNRYLLPFGYTYSRYIKESVFDALSNTQKDFVSLQACVVPDDKISALNGMQEFRLSDTIPAEAFNLDVYRSKIDELGRDSLVTTTLQETHIAGKVTTGSAKMLYLTVPYDEGWNLTVDGKPQTSQIVFAGMTGIPLTQGTHNIEFTYKLRYVGKGMILTILGLLAYAGLWIVVRKNSKAAVIA